MTFFASVSIILVATVCCHLVNASGENLQPLPFDVNRQSKQLYVIPPPLYNYYNRYGAQFFMPARIEKDNSKVTGRQNSDVITITPVPTDCFMTDVTTNGYGSCTKGSRATSGDIIAKFGTIDTQVAVVALVPNSKNFSSLKITCSDLTNAVIFTNSGFMATTADSPIMEKKQTQVVIVSMAPSATVKCSWEIL